MDSERKKRTSLRLHGDEEKTNTKARRRREKKRSKKKKKNLVREVTTKTKKKKSQVERQKRKKMEENSLDLLSIHALYQRTSGDCLYERKNYSSSGKKNDEEMR